MWLTRINAYSVCSLLVYLILFNWYPQEIYANEVFDVYDLITGYENLLDFFEPRMDMLNVDGVFGLVIACDQLENILDLKIHKSLKLYLKELHKRTGKIVINTKELNHYEANPEYATISEMLEIGKWKRSSEFFDHRLKALATPRWSYSDLAHWMFTGQPQETDSDRCIGDVISFKPKFVEHYCRFNKTVCPFNMTDATATHGYPLTHKLLYWQVADVVGCMGVDTDMKIRDKLCSKILSEAKVIEKLDFPYFAHDLFIEQVLLCGMEGYTEFLTDKWRKKILSWQNEHGCFTTTSPDKTRSLPSSTHRSVSIRDRRYFRAKRETNMMDFGCDTHINGLAAAAYMLNLHYIFTSPSWCCTTDE